MATPAGSGVGSGSAISGIVSVFCVLSLGALIYGLSLQPKNTIVTAAVNNKMLFFIYVLFKIFRYKLKKACKGTKNISRAQINSKKSEKKYVFLAYVKFLL